MLHIPTEKPCSGRVISSQHESSSWLDVHMKQMILTRKGGEKTESTIETADFFLYGDMNSCIYSIE